MPIMTRKNTKTPEQSTAEREALLATLGERSPRWPARLSGSMREGYTDHNRRVIVTDNRLEPAARLVVLLHEAAHAVPHGDLDAGEYQAHRGVCETEAESTAYVLAHLLGLDVDASSISYIAGWSHADASILTAAGTNVLHAVNTIAEGLGLDNAEDADQPGDQISAA
jgi:hypothetical protein